MGIIFGTTFSTYALVTKLLAGEAAAASTTVQLIGGLASGITSSVPRSAFEKVKTVMQVQARSQAKRGQALYASSWHCGLAIVRTEGLGGLFQGYTATAFREGLQQLIYFYVAGITRTALAPVVPASLLPLFAGAAPGMATWLPPFICIDVVKSRLESAPRGKYAGFLDCARQIYRDEPWTVWCRGLGAALMRGALMHATIFLVRDRVMSAL